MYNPEIKTQFTSITENGGSQKIGVDKIPDECPLCHKKVTPDHGQSFSKTNQFDDESLQVIFRCPNDACKNVFIAYYQKNGINGYYKCTRPGKPQRKDFSETVTTSFVNFVAIYNQAFAAEQAELDIICGAGYRKALEFLIKDYLIAKIPADSETIKKEFLGTLIEKRVEHAQLKAVAKRAAWLGNDETHYERRWEGKDVADLKNTIELAIRWIETEKLTQDLLKDMPEIEYENKTK